MWVHFFTSDIETLHVDKASTVSTVMTEVSHLMRTLNSITRHHLYPVYPEEVL